MHRIFQVIFIFVLLILGACATKTVEISTADNPQAVIQDLKLICKDIASNRVGNGDQANNRVGNGAPMMSAASDMGGSSMVPALLKTETGNRVYSMKFADRAKAAKQVAGQLGEKDFSCP